MYEGTEVVALHLHEEHRQKLPSSMPQVSMTTGVNPGAMIWW